MTNAADNAALVRRIFEEGWNRQTFDYLEGRTATTIPFHYNGVSMEVAGDSLADLVVSWRQAFPDLLMEVRHLVADEDMVAVAVVMRATHRGEWWGFRPTGRPVEAEEMMFFRFEGSQLVEMWEVFDEHALRQQISFDAGGDTPTTS